METPQRFETGGHTTQEEDTNNRGTHQLNKVQSRKDQELWKYSPTVHLLTRRRVTTNAHTRAEKEMCPVPTDGQQKWWQKDGIKNQRGRWSDENVRPKPAGWFVTCLIKLVCVSVCSVGSWSWVHWSTVDIWSIYVHGFNWSFLYPPVLTDSEILRLRNELPVSLQDFLSQRSTRCSTFTVVWLSACLCWRHSYI